MKNLALILILAVSLPLASRCAAREWSDSTGKFHIQAEVVEVKDGKVHLKKQDGSIKTVPLERLSEADQKFLKEQAAPAKQEPASKVASGEADAIAEIKKLGGYVTLDELRPEKPVIMVKLEGPEVTDAGVEHLKGLTQLYLLELQFNKVTDAGLEHLKGLTKLQVLRMSGTKITDAGLEHLKGLTKLHELCAIQTQVTAEGAKKFQQAMPTCEIRFNGGVLAAQKVPEEQVAPAKPQLVKSGVALKQDDVIAEIKKLGGSVTLDEKRPEKPVIGVSIAIVPALPWRKDIEHPRSFTDAEMTYLEGLTELQQLHLFGTKITDAGLEHLKGLTRLQQVDLRGAKITGTGLEYLKGMTQLRNLDLSGSKVTDTGLEHLKGLPQLLVLNLNCTEITDAGLENLKGLTTLKELKLWGTKVTDTGLEHLRGLTYLHDLCLLDTPVTYEGAKKFHLAVPNCTIGTAHGALAAQQAAPALIPAPPAAIAAAGAGRKSDGPPKELAVDLGGGIKLEMVLIPAGEFMMGSPDSDKFGKAEIPQHRVRITKPFYLGKYLVTQEQWKVVMDCYPPGFWGPKNPRTDASWYDCWTFLDKLNQKVGGGRFLLPTEAQWEYACRAGSTTKYCFGNEESGLADYAWYMSNSDHTTHPVGEKKPNAWGLYDMHGNVWEWCQDWCDDGYYARSPTDDPEGPANPSSPPGLATGSDPSRVCRGGSTGHPVECRSACRYSAPPNDRRGNVGLRVSFVLEDK